MKSSERVVAAAQPEVGSARRPTRAGVGGDGSSTSERMLQAPRSGGFFFH